MQITHQTNQEPTIITADMANFMEAVGYHSIMFSNEGDVDAFIQINNDSVNKVPLQPNAVKVFGGREPYIVLNSYYKVTFSTGTNKKVAIIREKITAKETDVIAPNT